MNERRTPCDEDDTIRQAFELAASIRPMLAGRGPDVVGICLGELVSILLAGHHPDIRDEVFSHFMIHLVGSGANGVDSVKRFLDGVVFGGGESRMPRKVIAMPTPSPVSLEETAARGVEAITALIKERDELLAASERMKTDVVVLRERCEQLEGRLTQALVERDHYMRYATELTARLGNIQTLIATTITESKHGAYKPPLVPGAKKQPLDIDSKWVSNLINRLPQGGGAGEAA
jgi:hypothetical protein